MKNISVAVLGFIVLSVGVVSCKKCAVCSKENVPQSRLCDNDYDSQEGFDLAIEAYTRNGYSCVNEI